MRPRESIIIAASILLMAGAAASAQTESNQPRRSIQHAAQISGAETKLSDAIAIAEKHTGGIAVAVRLTTDSQELRDEPGAEQWDTGRTSPTEPDARTDVRRTPADRREVAQEQANQAVTSPMFAVVTCVIDRSKVRDVYVDLAKGSVLIVRTPQARNGSTHYDQDRGDPMEYQSRRLFVRASDLMNSSVRNTHGEKLGEIDELVLDPESNRVIYGVLRRGGFLGMGESRYAISTSEFHNASDRRVTIRLDEGDFKDQTGFNKNSWPLRADPQWSSSESRTDAQQTAAKRITKASEIFGSKLLSSGGETIGTVSDLIVEPGTGLVHYAIISTTRGELTIPIRAIQAKGKDYTIAKTLEQMQFMPTIRPDRDPDWSDERWNRRMRESYGTTDQSESASSERRGG